MLPQLTTLHMLRLNMKDFDLEQKMQQHQQHFKQATGRTLLPSQNYTNQVRALHINKYENQSL